MTEAVRAGEVRSLRLLPLRMLVDALDDVLVATLGARRIVARCIGGMKQSAGQEGRDATREARIRTRARLLARRLGVPEQTVDRVLEAAIQDAVRAQDGDAYGHDGAQPLAAAAVPAVRVLALLPPPRVLAPVLARVPASWRAALLRPALRAARTAAGNRGWLDGLDGRRLGIEVRDLGLRWTVQVERGRACLVQGEAEACVRGSATDLLALAARIEDADTLFFQRRLVLTGDTELGLILRNVLDRVEWSSVPLGWRILLQRTARLACVARAAHLAVRGTAQGNGPMPGSSVQ